MADAVQVYLDYVRALPGEIAEVEQWVDLSSRLGATGQGGTADFASVQIHDGWLHVVDYKHGKGVKKFAKDNPQLMLYGIGMYDRHAFLGPIRGVTLHIVQPRLDHIDSWDVSPDQLAAKAAELARSVQAAKGPNPPFQPTEEGCRFCKGAGSCKAYAKWASDLMQAEFEDLTTPGGDLSPLDPELLTPEQRGALVLQLKQVRNWVDKVEKAALADLRAGRQIPGLKLVPGRNKRSWEDEEAAQKKLKGKRFKIDDIAPRKLLSPAQAEKLLGKDKFQKDLGPLVHVEQGPPTIASSDDPRPSVDPGEAQGFEDLTAPATENEKE